MKQMAFTYNKKLLLPLIALSVIGATVITFKAIRTDPAERPISISKKVNPQFIFSEQAAPDWHTGPINHTSLAVFNKQSDCFVSFESKSESVDENSRLQKIRADLTAGGYTVTDIAAPTVTLQQAETKTNYVLHQLSVTGSGADNDVYKGQEFGYIPTANGNVYVQGYCKNPVALPSTVTALSAVIFKP